MPRTHWSSSIGSAKCQERPVPGWYVHRVAPRPPHRPGRPLPGRTEPPPGRHLRRRQRSRARRGPGGHRADDASEVEDGGDGSSRSVSHKVTLNDEAYVSDGAPRSESANNELRDSLVHVGDEHRYEFSVLLKDWETGKGDAGDIIFQGKHAGGNKPSFYLMAKRNEIAFRSPLLDLQATVVGDVRAHVNKWMRFRVDVRWAEDKTGYYKVSAKLPGESGFTLKKTYSDVNTFHPENPTTFGYIKWGLYRPASSTAAGDPATRVVRHDDIRITDLSTS
ncbi:heparin lyase I family protein [Streptomyces sp. NPDC055060]